MAILAACLPTDTLAKLGIDPDAVQKEKEAEVTQPSESSEELLGSNDYNRLIAEMSAIKPNIERLRIYLRVDPKEYKNRIDASSAVVGPVIMKAYAFVAPWVKIMSLPPQVGQHHGNRANFARCLVSLGLALEKSFPDVNFAERRPCNAVYLHDVFMSNNEALHSQWETEMKRRKLFVDEIRTKLERLNSLLDAIDPQILDEMEVADYNSGVEMSVKLDRGEFFPNHVVSPLLERLEVLRDITVALSG